MADRQAPQIDGRDWGPVSAHIRDDCELMRCIMRCRVVAVVVRPSDPCP